MATKDRTKDMNNTADVTQITSYDWIKRARAMSVLLLLATSLFNLPAMAEEGSEDTVVADQSSQIGRSWTFQNLEPVSIGQAKLFVEQRAASANITSINSTTSGLSLNSISTTSFQTPNDPKIVELVAGLSAGLNINSTVEGMDVPRELVRRFYEYVANNIDYSPYWGHLKSPTLTLQDRSANDFDQAILLASMLQAAGFTAQYWSGTGIVPYINGPDDRDLAHWLDLEGETVEDIEANATTILANGGIGLANTDGDGNRFYRTYNGVNLAGILLVRVWLKVILPDGTGHFLDPAFKVYDHVDGIDVIQAINFNQSQLDLAAGGSVDSAGGLAKSFNITQVGNQLKSYARTLKTVAENGNGQLLSGKKLRQRTIATLPNDVEFIYNAGNAIAYQNLAGYTHTLRIQYGNVNYVLRTADILGKKLSLTFAGSATSPRGQFWLDDTLLFETSAGTSTSAIIEAYHPYAGGINQAATVGFERGLSNKYVILTSFMRDNTGDMLKSRRERLIKIVDEFGADSHQAVTETLNIMGQTFMRETAMVNDIAASLENMHYEMPHRFGIIGQTDTYGIDIPGSLLTGSSRVRNQGSGAFFRSTSFLASAFEHGVLEQQEGAQNDVLSTVKTLYKGNANGSGIVALKKNTIENYRTTMVNNGYKQSEVTGIKQTLDSEGGTIIAPAGAVSVFGFGVSAYAHYSESGGSVQMAIGARSGGIKAKCPEGTSANSVSIQTNGDVNGGITGCTDVVSPKKAKKVAQVIKKPNGGNDPKNTNSAAVESGGCPINFNTGDKFENHTDIVAGRLGFSRYYNSSSADNQGVLGYGWSHNLSQRVTEHTDHESSLGSRNDSDATATIVGLSILIELLKDDKPKEPSIRQWLHSTLVSQWLMERLNNNAVSVVGLSGRSTFIDVTGDGDFSGPAKNTSTLLRSVVGSNNQYRLQSRFGTVSQFDTDGHLASVTDLHGNQVLYTYTGSGETKKVSKVANNYGDSLSLAYASTTGDLNTVTDNTGRSVRYTRDANNNLTTVTDVANQNWTYTYDNQHRLTQARKPDSSLIKTVTYDSQNRAITQTWPRQSGAATNQYYYSGFLTTLVDEFGHSKRYYMDDQKRMIKTEDALGRTVNKTFDHRNYLIKTTNPSGASASRVYDANDNLVSSTNALGHSTTLQYDSQHRLIKATDPLGQSASTQYNTKHQPVQSSVDPGTGNPIQTSTTYDNKGHTSTVTDANNITTTLSYDAKGYPNTTKTSTHPVVDTDYDALGRLIKITDQAGAVTQFDYDVRGNVTKIIDPLNRATTMSYDNIGRLKSSTDRNGITSSIVYVPSTNLVEKVDYPNTALDVSFSYNLRNQVKQMTDGLGQTSYQYDTLGRLIQTTDPHGFSVGYQYNINGNLATLIYPGDKQVDYGYDALNRLTSVTDWLDNVTTYQYDNASRLIKTTHSNGSTTSRSYDQANRLVELVDQKEGGEVIARQQFTLDGNGNPLNVQRTQPQAPNLTDESLSYQYNAKKTRLNTVTDTTSNTVKDTFSYDNEGQQISKNQENRVFDKRHRLTSQANKTYHYDGVNNRLKVDSNGETRYFIYDAGNNLLAEANESKQIMRYYVQSNGLAHMIQNNQAYTYHYNATGHTVAMTDKDNAIVNQYAYSPFGLILGETQTADLEQPFKYVGKYGVQHENDEIYYMRARYYDAQIGRFVKEDPIGISGGLNVSLYVGGNPIVYTDPSGNCPWCIGAAIGFGFEAVSQVRSGNFNPGRLLGATAVGAVGGGIGHIISRGVAAGRAAGILSVGESRVAEVGLNGVSGALVNTGVGLANGETSAAEIGNNLRQGAIAGAIGAGAGLGGAGAGLGGNTSSVIGAVTSGLVGDAHGAAAPSCP